MPRKPRPQCDEENCTSLARSGFKKCKKHGGGPRCTFQACTTAALSPGNKCGNHGGGHRCTDIACTKLARDKTGKCVEHGGGRRCVMYKCEKSAQGPTNKCIEHGGGHRCDEDGCTTGAYLPSKKCIKHGGGPRCTFQACTTGAYSNGRCVRHGGGRRCDVQGCNESALLSTSKCGKHGGGNRCPNCVTWIDSRLGSPRYDGYCATCFKRLFPDDPRSNVIYEHTKEIRVRNTINEHFEGFIHDTMLYTGGCDCTHRRRIDHRLMIGGTMLAIETDEFAHRDYDAADEEIRYDDLYMIYSGKWIFIRFNPDGQGVDMDDKLDTLVETIEHAIERIENDENTDLVEIIKLYY